MAKVVLVDDEITLVQMVTELLRGEGHEVVPFINGQAAADAIPSVGPELVIANLCSEKGRVSGFNVLHRARALNPPPVAIVITSAGALETAMEAMRRGAYDYLGRPFTLDELKLRAQRALAYHSALSENAFLRRQVESKFQFREIIGMSAGLQSALNLIARAAETDCSIFITGLRGTGKELVARAVHFNSARRFAPFLVVGCGSLSEPLLEVELFGSRKGSFPGHIQEQAGVIQRAEGGTILLDQIGLLPAALQLRLLRVLQDHEIRRPGENEAVPVDVRILAANEESIESRLAAGTFREDLFRALTEVTIELPPLHERAEDIPLLVSHFLEGRKHPRNGQPMVMTREALDLCCSYRWPGNIRELENAIVRACAVADDNALRVADLPAPVQQLSPHEAGVAEAAASRQNGHGYGHPLEPVSETFGAKGADVVSDVRRVAAVSAGQELMPLKQFLRDQELSYLHHTLAQVGGSKERAAELLGISLATIYRKLSEPAVV